MGKHCRATTSDGSTLSAVVLVLCEWAWAKVWLDMSQKIGCPLIIKPAIVEYRRALRVKRTLDRENESTEVAGQLELNLSNAPSSATRERKP